jgi:molybdate/tungstate transport system substrate-binding protein
MLLILILYLCCGCQPSVKESAVDIAPAKVEAGEQTRELEPGKLVIFHAGSLSVPFREISRLFNQKHPQIKVLAEAAGSRDCARKVSDHLKPCDILASADYTVIDTLIVPEFADYNIRFATNEMAIAYTGRSLRADEFNISSWADVLLMEGVAVGRADPNRDPCGYRTVLTCKLAEKYYEREGLAEAILTKDGDRYIRPKETDLLALLEAGEIDYLFIYRSVAEQHGLEYLLLPDEINLKTAEHADFYATATCEVTGKKPGDPNIVKKGGAMVYSVTIPKNSENPEAAMAWLLTLLSPEGRAIMEQQGQPFIDPPICEQHHMLPANLKEIVVPLE